MKYKIFNLIIFIIVSIYIIIGFLIFLAIKKDENNPCSWGKDTVAQFGKTCNYTIFYKSKDNYVFFNEIEQSVIVPHVYSYIEKKPYVYVFGQDSSFTKVNYQTDEIIQSNDIETFSEFDIQIFQELQQSMK